MPNLFQIIVKKLHVGCCNKASPVPKNKNNVHTKIVLWSELDENLLAEIMSRLSPTDQTRFHAVCKTWHSVRPIAAYKLLPWFVSVKIYPCLLKSLKFRLHDPYSHPKFLISTYEIPFSKLSMKDYILDFLMFATLRQNFLMFATLRQNWFFFSVCQIKCSGTIWHTYSFLFSPLTRNFIQLPELVCQFSMSSSFTHTFSANPDSPDCVFLVLNTCDYENELVVMTCRQGDTEWKVRKFYNFVPGSFTAEYINGTFFAVSSFGQVALYNIMNGELEIEKLDRDDDFNQLSNSQMDIIVFELNGDLTVLYIGFSRDHVRGDYYIFPHIPCIKKFDRGTKAWVPLRSLGDQTLFVGDRSNSFAKVGAEQAKTMGVSSNTIYYYYHHGCIIYSFENGVLVQLKYSAAPKNMKSGDLLQFHYDTAIRDKKNYYFWLEPPVI